MYNYLKAMSDIPIEVLFHTKKTHGMTSEVLSQVSDDSLIIIPDASVNTPTMADKALERNIKCLVLDHHEININTTNVVTINNRYGDVQNVELSGAGVTHKFCQYVDKINNTNYAEQFYDLVALSIISDSRDVTFMENRAYIYYTFEKNKINNKFLCYLCDTLIPNKITPHELSFKVINILNAVCRLDNQELKEQLFKCFVGENDDFAGVLDACKKAKRQQDEKVKVIIEDNEVLEADNLVVMVNEEVCGLNGLVANKLQTKYLKPAFVVHTDGENYTGSVRSPVDIRELAEESKLFIFNQGHPSAYGTSFAINNLNKICDYFSNLDFSDSQHYNVVGSYYNTKIPNNLFSIFNDYDILWSKGLPKPLVHYRLCCTGADWLSLRGATIKLIHNDITFIKFFVSNLQKEKWHIGEDVLLQIDIIGNCGINEYGGKSSPQVIIEQMEVSQII